MQTIIYFLVIELGDRSASEGEGFVKASLTVLILSYPSRFSFTVFIYCFEDLSLLFAFCLLSSHVNPIWVQHRFQLIFDTLLVFCDRSFKVVWCGEKSYSKTKAVVPKNPLFRTEDYKLEFENFEIHDPSMNKKLKSVQFTFKYVFLLVDRVLDFRETSKLIFGLEFIK